MHTVYVSTWNVYVQRVLAPCVRVYTCRVPVGVEPLTTERARGLLRAFLPDRRHPAEFHAPVIADLLPFDLVSV